MSGRITIRWGRVIASLVLGVILAGMAWWWLSIASEDRVQEPTSVGEINEDPWGGVPQCTDEIADAGGICHGEPTSEPNGLADVIEPISYAAPAPSAEATPETWEPGTPETQVFEDGSWLAADGTTGCTPGAACDQLPPVPAGTPTTPDGGYWPTLTLEACAQEDSDNCYWDAELRGNGTGQSFIVVDGTYYYQEINK